MKDAHKGRRDIMARARQHPVLAGLAIIVLHFTATRVASLVVHLLGAHVTHSLAPAYYLGTPEGRITLPVHWDTALMQLTYGLYAALFLLMVVTLVTVTISLHRKGRLTKNARLVCGGVFVLAFPTLTSWPVRSGCENLASFPFPCYRTLDVITPVVMSVNPLHIAISALCAGAIAQAYFRFIGRPQDLPEQN